MNSDGLVTVYNTELALFEVITCNFKDEFVKPDIKDPFEETNKFDEY